MDTRKLTEVEIKTIREAAAKKFSTFENFFHALSQKLKSNNLTYSKSCIQKCLPKNPKIKSIRRINLGLLKVIYETIDAPEAVNSSDSPVPNLPQSYCSEAVLSLDPFKLPEKDKFSLIKNYENLHPKQSNNSWSTAQIIRLKTNEKIRPLNVEILSNAIPIIRNKIDEFRKSASGAALREVSGKVEDLFIDWNRSRNFPKTLTDEISNIYSYLGCADEYPPKSETQEIDVLLVSGARWSAKSRISHAIQLLKETTNCSLILTGGYPNYERSNPLPISEADYLAVQFQEQSRGNSFLKSVKVEIERRPRSFAETAAVVAHYFKQKKLENENTPLRVGLVTSTYGMRRLLWTFQAYYESYYSDSVDRFLPLSASGDRIGKNQLFEPISASAGGVRFGYEVFIREYLKLIGARLSGEL